MTMTQMAHSNVRAAVAAWPLGVQHLISAVNPSFAARTRVIERASTLTTNQLRKVVGDAYTAVVSEVSASSCPHPVRFWNFLPSIHADMGGGLDRYMVFNAGRLDGFERAMQSTDAVQGRVATASAVGHDGDDLVIHCLSADRPGRPVTNPRQIDPVRYSARYGPRPPCFARATAVPGDGGSTRLFVGGTASIRGEASLHDRHLAEQIEETFANLAAVVTAASAAVKLPLARFTELRVYHAAQAVPSILRDAVAAAFVNVKAVEFVRADLCRAELLVEIEGLAEI